MNAPLRLDALPLALLTGAATATVRAWQGPATVCAATDAGWLLNADAGSFSARVAASCLLQPQPGDRVWCCAGEAAVDESPRCWITAVLERASDAAPAQVQLPAQATLRSADGTLAVEAEALTVRTKSATLLAEQATGIGACWEAIVGAVKLTGSTLQSVFERVSHTAQHHQRFTEGTDTTQAGLLDLRAQGLATLQAEHVLVQGERLIKQRGAQIHMG